MAKSYQVPVGDIKGKDKKTYHVYYNIKKDSFTCTDQSGKEMHLTPKMHSRIARKFNLNRSVYRTIYKLKPWIFVYFFLVVGVVSIHYRHVLFDLPEIIDISRSHDPERLKEKVVEYISENDNLTFEQKEYLSNSFSLYLEDYGDCYEFNSSLDMLNNFKSVDIKYKDLSKSGNSGEYYPAFNLIKLSTDDRQVLAHEFSHCSNPSLFDWRLQEGYATAIETSYGCEGFANLFEKLESNNIPSYIDENEYLLLISEIIGKEKTMYYLINHQANEMQEEIARVTSTDISEVESIFSLMRWQTFVIEVLQDKEKSDLLASQIKQKLANLVILANKKNENNFIVQNAISQDYIVGSSFLRDEYIFYDNNYENFIIIDDTNKFDKDYSRDRSFLKD